MHYDRVMGRFAVSLRVMDTSQPLGLGVRLFVYPAAAGGRWLTLDVLLPVLDLQVGFRLTR